MTQIEPDLTMDDARGTRVVSVTELNKAIMAMKEKSTAMSFLMGGYKPRYSSLWTELRNNYLKGDKDLYPNSIQDAYCLMKHHWLDQLLPIAYINNTNGLTFLQKGNEQD
mmetsp:Transcript_34849/g.80584  ORF Transcript_34849/g.80584 Transcript_34849/m.80584 type:complete len:110 (-) Transcript_34849:1298-1627(-)